VRIYQSRFGAVVGLLYTAGAIYVVQDELRYTGGGWINLRGLATALVTAPSQLTLGFFLEQIGVGRVNFAQPGLSGYSQLALHVLVTAICVYLAGFAIEWSVRRLLRQL
jgi:hypothetical protein